MDGKTENTQQPIDGARQHWQAGVAAHHPVHAFVLPGSGKNRPFRDIQPEQRHCLSVTARRSQLAQVITLAAARIEATGDRVGRQIRHYRLAYRSGDWLVKTLIEKASPRRNHCLAVAGIAGAFVLHRQQVGIALAGDIETVTGGAAPGGALAIERPAIQGAGEGAERNNAHKGMETAMVDANRSVADQGRRYLNPQWQAFGIIVLSDKNVYSPSVEIS